MNDPSQSPSRVAAVTGASRGPGAASARAWAANDAVGEALRFALRMPPSVRVEEIVLRSSQQAPEL